MKTTHRSLSSQLGVTLLEIMLVLAIAAIVIILSIRYYQQASLQNKIVAGTSGITAVMAVLDQLKGSGVTANTQTVTQALGGKMPISPWTGADITFDAASTPNTITLPIGNTDDCNAAALALQANPNILPTCTGDNLVVKLAPNK